MFGTSTFISLGIMATVGVLLPLSVSIWWIRTRREKISTILLGALSFLAFALVLESTVHTLVALIVPALFENVVSYTIYGALMAGLFEETGRFFFFKVLLKKRTNRETAISYGIGHGGFEALIFLTVVGIEYIVYAVMINNGTLASLIATAAESGADTSALEQLPVAIASLTGGAAALSCFERVTAMLFHIALSIVVFYAVKRSKVALYLLAILLHALFDVPAALYQKGVITSLPILESFMFVFAAAVLIAAYKLLYSKDTKTEEVETSA